MAANSKTAKGPGKQQKLSLGVRNTLVGMSFILPNFAGFFIFVLIPVVASLVISFTKWDGFNPMQFVGLKNFSYIFSDKYFIAALGRTLIYTASTVVITTFVSLGLAVLLNKKIRAKGLFRGAIFFPYVASIVAVGVVWNMLFQKDYGPVNEFLRWVGVQNLPGWTASTTWALPAVIIVSVWKNMGYYMIVYLAALQDVPVELYEASMIDGASKTQHFWRVVMPMLAPSTFFVVLMLTINSFKAFDLIYVMTEGGPGQATTLIVNYIYNKNFIPTENYGVGSAAAMVLFVIVAIVTVIQFRMEKKLSD
ncbi:MAG: carbohydrate ABC transporter permease [Oscillospiraceae bacterium]